jgi:hypothetical protein
MQRQSRMSAQKEVKARVEQGLQQQYMRPPLRWPRSGMSAASHSTQVFHDGAMPHPTPVNHLSTDTPYAVSSNRA